VKREDAVQAIHELIKAEVETVKQENFRAGGVTKGAANRELSAVCHVFAALTGESPNEEEIAAMIEL